MFNRQQIKEDKYGSRWKHAGEESQGLVGYTEEQL